MSGHLGLLQTVRRWQVEACQIKPPAASGLHAAVGKLTGPAFFPEGFGLTQSAIRDGLRPTVIAVGHNFGCKDYLEQITPAGREDQDGKGTWCKLDNLLSSSGINPDECFRTNWFIGLRPLEQMGKFLLRPDTIYEENCLRLLFEQIRYLKPKAILLLGRHVVRRSYQLTPALSPWKNAKTWAEIYKSSIEHSVRNVEVPSAQFRTNIAALLHPSLGAANEALRMKDMVVPLTQIEIIKGVIG